MVPGYVSNKNTFAEKTQLYIIPRPLAPCLLGGLGPPRRRGCEDLSSGQQRGNGDVGSLTNDLTTLEMLLKTAAQSYCSILHAAIMVSVTYYGSRGGSITRKSQGLRVHVSALLRHLFSVGVALGSSGVKESGSGPGGRMM